MTMSKPLAGLKVIDAGRVLAGPFCGQMLADNGADVIKIEALVGDENRHWSPFAENGQSCNFQSVNRGKRSVTLNLKAPEGRELLRTLLADADVLIHSFLPDTATALGIDHDELRASFPRLIICAIGSFGTNGPLSRRPGYDTLFQAFSGIMSMTGERDGGPVRAGVSFIDMTTGILGYAGVVTALAGRAVSGQGQVVRVSLLETALSLLGYHAVSWLQTGVLPHREGSGIWHLVPYQAFQCSDGAIITGALNDHTWRNICRVIGREDLGTDPALATNALRLDHRARIIGIFEAAFASGTRREWTERLERGSVPVAPLHTIDEALTHEQSLANDMVVEVTGQTGEALKLLGLPFKVGPEARVADRPPPLLGEHTAEVLAERAGLSAERVAGLRAGGVI